jgi:F-box protein 11
MNTNIINNMIFGGRCEGIFIIEGGSSMIYDNKIEGNYDGIVCATSVPSIKNNKIKNNKRCGVIVRFFGFDFIGA